MANIYWEEHQSGDEKLKHWSEESDNKKRVETFTLTTALSAPKKNVGGYDITGNYGGANSVMFMMTKKPKWFHRICTRFFLGWNWVDKK